MQLNRVVQNSVSLMERTFPKMIEIETILAKNLREVNADASQIGQVLMNLCINAKEAMHQGGRLTIETKNTLLDDEYCQLHLGAKPGPHVIVEITDTGGGMNKQTMERMFEPFFTTKGWDFKKGTGLGLSIARGIIEQHGGWIAYESEPGHGTIFRVYLQVIQDSPVVSTAENVSGPEKILLVDDEDYVRDLGKRILERAGFSVVTASNGKEAIEIYQEEQSNVRLVVLDLIMRQMGGERCLEELVKINPLVKVVISSGHSLGALERDRLASSAKGFVNKPYRMKQFVEVVKGVLTSE